MKRLLAFLCATAVLLFIFSACATRDTRTQGRTDRLGAATFYKTYHPQRLPGPDRRIGILPVTVQPNLGERVIFGDEGDPVLAELIEAIASKIESMEFAAPIEDRALLRKRGMPGIYIGSSEGDHLPFGAAVQRGRYEKYAPMVIYASRSSDVWRDAVMETADEHGVDYLIRIWLSLAQYPRADKGFVAKKVVLGTGYERDVRFLGGEDAPVEVLQLSGYLVDSYGNLIRAGAEGILHSDTPFWAQLTGSTKTIDRETAARVLSELRRDDLPGQPLAWEEALRQLVMRLANRES